MKFPIKLASAMAMSAIALTVIAVPALANDGTEGSASPTETTTTAPDATPSEGRVTAVGVRANDMFRLYNPYTGEHFYTSSAVEKDKLVKLKWKDEGIGWLAPVESTTPVYRLYNPYAPGGDHHYTMDAAECLALQDSGWKYEGVGWYSDDYQSVPLYRQYNPNAKTGIHNYTASKVENDSLVKAGWQAEGVAWYGLN
jgi:hypothetical protein